MVGVLVAPPYSVTAGEHGTPVAVARQTVTDAPPMGRPDDERTMPVNGKFWAWDVGAAQRQSVHSTRDASVLNTIRAGCLRNRRAKLDRMIIGCA